MQGWWWIVYALAIARATGLITTDYLTKPLRDWLFRKLNPDKTWHERLAYLIECPWCVSVWVAAALVPVAYWWGAHWSVQVAGLILAASQVTGLLATIGNKT